MRFGRNVEVELLWREREKERESGGERGREMEREGGREREKEG